MLRGLGCVFVPVGWYGAPVGIEGQRKAPARVETMVRESKREGSVGGAAMDMVG